MKLKNSRIQPATVSGATKKYEKGRANALGINGIPIPNAMNAGMMNSGSECLPRITVAPYCAKASASASGQQNSAARMKYLNLTSQRIAHADVRV